MSRVGNDVVDLDDPAIADSHLRERFLARVCAPSERALLAQSSQAKSRDGQVLLWSFFAAKEAAFKVVSKLGPRPVFAHRLFVVAEDLRSVRYDGRWLHLWVEVAGACVHAVASTDAVAPLSAVETAQGDPGVAARRLLLGRLGLAGVEVARDPLPRSWDGFGPPRLVRDGVGLERDISLSHDGRFVGFAAAR